MAATTRKTLTLIIEKMIMNQLLSSNIRIMLYHGSRGRGALVIQCLFICRFACEQWTTVLLAWVHIKFATPMSASL